MCVYKISITQAVKGAVFAVVQSTVPVLPKPVCDAPDANDTVLPADPTVS